jgi:hypothetical protein
VKTALIKDITIKVKQFSKSQAVILLIKTISPNKLIEGGAAMLQILIRNHHRAIDGIVNIIPLQIIIFREPSRSYKMLVKQNIPEEHRP